VEFDPYLHKTTIVHFEKTAMRLESQPCCQDSCDPFLIFVRENILKLITLVSGAPAAVSGAKLEDKSGLFVAVDSYEELTLLTTIRNELRDLFYETPFRLKTFWMTFHPQISTQKQ
jgi:hypothetical protein